jgi:DNA-binding beta-propeller fold protein YncE
VTTLAGWFERGYTDGVGSTARFYAPVAVSISRDGTFALVVDNDRVRHIKLATAQVTTLVNTFPDEMGFMTSFSRPQGIAISNDGVFALVADTLNARLRRIEIATAAVTTLAGSGTTDWVDGTGSMASFHFPTCVAISSDGVFALVTEENRVRRIEIATAQVTTLAGSGMSASGSGNASSADGMGTMASFNIPLGIAISSDNVFALVSESSVQNNHVRRIEIATGKVTTLTAPLDLNWIWLARIAISSDSSFALVSDSGFIRGINLRTGQVAPLAGTHDLFGGFADGTGSMAKFSAPQGVAVSHDNTFALVVEMGNVRVRHIELATAAPCSAGFYCVAGSSTPTQFACDAGSYCSATGLSSSATQSPCSAGYFCPSGSSSATQSACSVGSFCPEGAKVSAPCPENFYCPDASHAVKCASTQSCPAGTSAPSLSALTIALIVVGALVVAVAGGAAAWLVRGRMLAAKVEESSININGEVDAQYEPIAERDVSNV